MENKSDIQVIHFGETFTKRELFAAMAMQGLAAKGQNQFSNQIASAAVLMADALIAELEKTKE